ncbi:protein of unknown function [Taphrina deformans PYCC 5710]|uniref:Uncharacterized protein n=1 Tax=Taphrina deformans (strain PYCC 5710 / ATCC 11124 / CBS 356.35 / IMI 108563 / JCM 9778 / NBRC 8474) TaxID=1097556 RepID=R4XJR9_TAPDE|nr:protein of unknown function [Taphrina deformans PYCC 5710]|eukprot:CCG84678.1 protein of unknown function [Taphrina deformans PYCC 5710]
MSSSTLRLTDAASILEEIESNAELDALRLHMSSSTDRDTILRIWKLAAAMPHSGHQTLVLTQGNRDEGLNHIHGRHMDDFLKSGLLDPLQALDQAIARGPPFYHAERDAFLYAVTNDVDHVLVLLVVVLPRTTILTAYPYTKRKGVMRKIYRALGVADTEWPQKYLESTDNPAAQRREAKKARASQWLLPANEEKYRDSYRVGFAYRTCLALREPEDNGFQMCFADDEGILSDISDGLRHDLLVHNVEHEKVYLRGRDYIAFAKMELEELQLAHRLHRESRQSIFFEFGGVVVPASAKVLREARDYIYEELFRELKVIEDQEALFDVDFSSSPRKTVTQVD